MRVSSSLILFSNMVDTGYKCSNIVGSLKNGDTYECILVDSTGVPDPCRKCLYRDDDCDEVSCKEMKYYYTKAPRGLTDSKFQTLSRFKYIDMKEFSEKCMDHCMYYEENCYNTNKDTCFIRLIENLSLC